MSCVSGKSGKSYFKCFFCAQSGRKEGRDSRCCHPTAVTGKTAENTFHGINATPSEGSLFRQKEQTNKKNNFNVSKFLNVLICINKIRSTINLKSLNEIFSIKIAVKLVNLFVTSSPCDAACDCVFDGAVWVLLLCHSVASKNGEEIGNG